MVPPINTAARHSERRLDHGIDEERPRVLKDLNLESFLRPEVGEEAALGELEIVGQLPDREPFEADHAGQPQGVLQNGLTGRLAFAHNDKLVRSYGCFKGVRRTRAQTRLRQNGGQLE